MANFLINTAEKEKTNEKIYKRIVSNINKIIYIEKESLKNIKSLYQNWKNEYVTYKLKIYVKIWFVNH